ncbi:MAG TPA: RhuM family protein, partial [Leptospiraceae bacterium]|nr:RhuM family protein [Leptospiraceae bacterium]
NRADAEKEFMGLTNFSGALPTKKDISIAKNYLNKDELGRLNRLVSAFFDLAEMKAMEQTPMKMKDWLAELDKFTSMYGKGTLQNSGTVSNEKAIEKAESEYKKYQVKTISPVEEAYLDTIKNMQKKIEKKAKK